MKIKLDNWVKDILVDPLSKDKLDINLNISPHLYSSYGRKYPIKHGIYDLRLLNNKTTTDQIKYREGQFEFERQEKSVDDKNKDYSIRLKNAFEIYREFSIIGDCLDVGGHQGRLREFLDPKYKYLICDPFLDVFKDIKNQPNLLKSYPCLNEPVNFICCDAEFLPLKSESFQVVHMQSCLDHFLSPELALIEAHRVLKPNGELIIGVFISGVEFSFVRTKRKIFSSFGLKKYKDYHVWHPKIDQLIDLIYSCGFYPNKTFWQKNNKSIYWVRSTKYNNLMRQ